MTKMNKIIKYGWWVLIIIPLVFVFGVYVNNDYKITNEKTAKTEMPESQINSAFSEKNIDWDIAVGALSQHFKNLAKNNPDVDFAKFLKCWLKAPTAISQSM